MSDFSLMNSVRVVLITWPFLVLRAVILLISVATAILSIIVSGWIGYSIVDASWGADSNFAGAIAGGFIGFLLFFSGMLIAREYVFYLVKAAHLSMLVRALDGEVLPKGFSQIRVGLLSVKERFFESSALFTIDQAVKAVISSLSALVGRAWGFGGSAASNLLQSFLNIYAGHADEVVLCYILRKPDRDAWTLASEALTYYAQNAQALIKNASILSIVSVLLGTLSYVVATIAAITALYSFSFNGVGLTLAASFIVGAWVWNRIILKSLILACLLGAFFKLARDQCLDVEWQSKITGLLKVQK